MIKVTFTCKDPLIAAHCQQEYAEALRAKLEGANWRGPDDDKHLQEQLVRFLSAEAARQQWYDYEEVREPTEPATTGRSAPRRPLLNPDGTPRLLVPELVIDREAS
jgi:hypothetical protein